VRRQTFRVVTSTRQTLTYSVAAGIPEHCTACGRVVETIAPAELAVLASLIGYRGAAHWIQTAGGGFRICSESLLEAITRSEEGESREGL
jgi:hypothetical protein